MLVWTVVYAELLLARGVNQEGLYRGVDVGEESGGGEAFDEDVVAACDDGVANDIRVGLNDAVEAAVDEAELENVVGKEIFEGLENELGWQLCYVHDGVAFLLSRRVLALHALCLLVLERKSSRLVLEWFVIVANGLSWHNGSTT